MNKVIFVSYEVSLCLWVSVRVYIHWWRGRRSLRQRTGPSAVTQQGSWQPDDATVQSCRWRGACALHLKNPRKALTSSINYTSTFKFVCVCVLIHTRSSTDTYDKDHEQCSSAVCNPRGRILKECNQAWHPQIVFTSKTFNIKHPTQTIVFVFVSILSI